MIWRLLLFELVLVLVVVGVWLLGPLVGIKSVAWRVVIILALVLPPIIVVIWKLIARRRADKGLANAMRQQGEAHEDNVRPDRKEEITALNEAFNQALAGLRKSRLGGGRGSSLYALPWFMIIGPPAAGKSTALLRSGLRFPFTPGERKAVRGVGGTRNCDWWFSDQAILLDTAGRYSTEDDDQEEWTAFLRMLRKYRRKQPLNGLLVAVAVSDILTAKPDELEDLAHQVRARVDQVIRDLELSLPIYLLFTKCDLINGFVEFFGDLKKSRRSQIFGFTTKLTDGHTNIEELFSTEFDLLSERVRKRGLSRLASTRPQQRMEVFQFPLQFASVKDPLQIFTSILLNPNPYQESPRLRGIYFCSGTQEGRPIDRVMSMMGRALGLRDMGGQALPERTTKKSYFLRDVFTDVLVPDRELAGRTEAGLRRRGRLRAAGLVGAMLLSAAAMGLATTTFSKNSSLLSTNKDAAKKSRITTPEDPRKVTNSLKALDRFGEQVDRLRKYEADGAPFSLSLGFYQGSRIFTPAEQLLIKRSRQAFVLPAGSELEATLTDIANASDIKTKGAARDFDLLKAYLMVTNHKRLEIEFASNIMIRQWKKRLHPDVAQENELLEKITTRYLKLVKAQKASWLERDNDLIRNVRQALKARDADYRSVLGEDVEKRFRPFTLRAALRGRIQTVIKGKHSVPGVYTRRGWSYVRKRLAQRMVSGSKVEPWVLGEEANADISAKYRKRYFDQYIISWRRFLKGLSLDQPTSPQEALRLLDGLTEGTPMYKELFGSIAHNTALPLVELGKGSKQAGRMAARMIRGKAGRALRAADRLGVGKNVGKGPKTQVELYFAPIKELVEPPKGLDGRAQLGGLQQYLEQLNAVRDALSKEMGGEGAAAAAAGAAGAATGGVEGALNEARRVTKGVLASLPGELRRLVAPLFYAPLELTTGTAKVVDAQNIKKGFSGPCAAFREKLAGRYPFAKSKRAALMQDVIEFFGPGGTWQGYATSLKNKVVQRGNAYKPLPGKNVPAGILGFVNKGYKIHRALFPIGQQQPRARFEVRPQPAILEAGTSHQISEIIFEVEGTGRTYRNGPIEQWTFEWAGKSKRSRLLVRGANGLRAAKLGEGEWGLMRLIDQGRVSKRGSWTRVTWSLKGGQIRIAIDFRPARSQNPLFRRLRLDCR